MNVVVDLDVERGTKPSSSTDEADDDIVQGGDDDESVSLLGFIFACFGVRNNVPPIKLHPPLPTSETYLADLLRYELSRAKRNCFCYIRCLEPVDQELFQAKMVELTEASGLDRDTQEQFITQGCMKMGTWRRIMKQIDTFATYKLWRAAYWGEHAGRPTVSSATTDFRLLVETFVGKQEAKEVNLVHSAGHLESVPATWISPSSWSNDTVSQQLWAEISD